MNIWFDLSNSPHVNLFRRMIDELSENNSVFITSRPLANTVDLLDLHGLKHAVIGQHYGPGIFKKISGYFVRVSQLSRHLKEKQIDVSISQSSFHSPCVSNLLKLPSIYLNDNEHALGNIPAFLFAHLIMLPEAFGSGSPFLSTLARKKIQIYPGIKEGVYLWDLAPEIHHARQHRKVKKIPQVYIRPEPWTAQYYRAKKNFLNDLIGDLARDASVIVLPRGNIQAGYYRTSVPENVHVCSSAIDLLEIAKNCDLFIGAGGTMTRELATLGIPTISVYQDQLLNVDRYLIGEHALAHHLDLDASTALAYLENSKTEKNTGLLEKGKAAYRQIINAILNLKPR
jgi:predicted glycosyltransferase